MYKLICISKPVFVLFMNIIALNNIVVVLNMTVFVLNIKVSKYDRILGKLYCVANSMIVFILHRTESVLNMTILIFIVGLNLRERERVYFGDRRQ